MNDLARCPATRTRDGQSASPIVRCERFAGHMGLCFAAAYWTYWGDSDPHAITDRDGNQIR